MADSLEQAKKAIPADFRMISGCRDSQTSADVSNVASFQLPDPAGRAGGALTSALLNVTYADHQNTGKDLSFQDTLLKVRGMLEQKSFTQVPQLSSSRPMDIHDNFDLVPPGFSGTARAVMIGINYVGQNGELRGCHNDVGNMKEYIKDCHGFEEQNITVLMDDGNHTNPTHDNILAAYKEIVAASEPGDVVFLHYSGHGGKLKDDDGDEQDGYDETLVPLDYHNAGQIRDDDLFNTLVAPMPEGVFCTSIMDCCHSGTVLDLPYVFVADGEEQEMHLAEGFDFAPMMGLMTAFLAAGGGAAAGGGGGSDPMETAMQTCGCLIQ
mmetsp:Transcript_24321/g.67744  ORF Transcript_24321/g.67744 Transcript_24321/m.67744 type:complete len:324 (-) Transcript_24321:403-1374(-)|eukprot:CAMPEP_0198129594 /NCGR_PEP_ID=MMETSP1442-20131203/52085_1 /TAXON_ID= /ORGANISM="Craspedostauros australis, Strain CCMP3328" /LENGTH=323 /DNA_ID=CAMNT_0043790017 /DNA_START=58 /DNA_END=1029 /DNA_ORIENTATION=-